jgi:hypothetical protein
MPAPLGNKYAVGNRGGPGQASLYKPKYAVQARKACEAGFTDVELAELLDVSVRTVNNWKLEYEEFGAALTLGKDPSNRRVNRSLYQKAIGFYADIEKIFMTKDGEVVRVQTKEYHPPDTGSIIWWQRNRQPELWRDKHDIDINGKIEHAFTLNIFEHDLSGDTKVVEEKAAPRLKNGS